MTRFSALVLVLIAASSVHAAEKRLDRTFAVSPGGTLIVDADGASVQVAGNDTSQVTVRMSARDSEENLAKIKLDAVQSSDRVTVTLRREKKFSWLNWGSWNGEQHIEVTVPRRFNINVRTGGGSVELRDSVGSATLRTSGGSVTARNLDGNVELRTSGGGILADSIRGSIDAETSGGDVRLLQVDGKIRAHTSGGSVRCSLLGDNRGISATTSGGSVELTLPRTTTGNLDAVTSGGDVKSDIPVAITEARDGELRGSLNGGGERIEARTSGGNIRVRVSN
jgi:DUF4097 and DUF4098 domain-containing protein YvlB